MSGGTGSEPQVRPMPLKPDKSVDLPTGARRSKGISLQFLHVAKGLPARRRLPRREIVARISSSLSCGR
jgi:hypothetical protein